MKLLTIVLLVFCILMAVSMFVPAPNLALLRFTIVIPELSPWLAAFSLLACALAIRYRRRLAPFLLGTALLLSWPMVQVAEVERRMEAQLSPSAAPKTAPLPAPVHPGDPG